MALTAEKKQKLFHPVKWFFNPIPEGDGRIANRELSLHALGLAGQNLVCGLIGGQWFFYFCNTVMKIPPRMTGVMTFVSRLWDGINDPIAGTYIDNHRFRNGEKLRPWILYTAPFIGVFGTMIFFNFGFKSVNTAATVITVFFLLDFLRN
ncbi:MAG: MFS transporter [Oscillospiraceae bacterium]|nr:MFS transporter [Oscillospiraceae bacterium]